LSTEQTRELPAPHRRRRAAGFTLIEIVIVLAVLGFALALILDYKAPWSSALDLKATAAEVAQQLRLARTEAIARDQPVEFALDLARHRYRIDGLPAHPLPAQFALQMLMIAGEQQGPGGGAIRFNPDGSSSGGRISLSSGNQRIAVGVDWLTGRVTIAATR
jgi:general secretion pathway protein H